MDVKDKSVEAIAAMVKGRVVGDGSIIINNFAPLEKAGKAEISFLAEKKKIKLLAESSAAAVMVPEGLEDGTGKVLIEVANPYLAAAIVHSYFLQRPFTARGSSQGIYWRAVSAGP